MRRGLNSPNVVALVALPSAVALACMDTHEPVRPTQPSVEFEIIDGAHGGGNAAFYFLPPLVPQPVSTEPLDTSVAAFLSVEICVWAGNGCGEPPLARFTTESGPGTEALHLDATRNHYLANWHTDSFNLSSDAVYRIRILAAGAALGHADVDVVSSGRELKNVDTGEYLPLIDGRTLPIRFRVEPGAVFIVGSEGGTIEAGDGAVMLAIPPGALDRHVGITVQAASVFPSDPSLVPESAFRLDPDSIGFALPAALRLRYDPARVPPGIDETSLRPHRADEPAWVEVFESGAEAGSGAVHGAISRTGTYGVLEKRRVHSVNVIPDSAHIEVGRTLQLSATVRDSLGHPLKRAVTWVSSDEQVASVDSGGHVTAHASGRATITATSLARTGSAHALVTNPAYPHEVAGFTQISERRFDAVAEAGWVDARLTKLLTIVEDSTAPVSPPRVGRALLPRDSVGGSGFGTKTFIVFDSARHRSLYVSFWFKFSENWQGHRSHVNKILFITADESLANPVYLAVMGEDSGPLHPEVRLQGIPIVQARNLPPNIDQEVRITRGQWHGWELLLVMNTGDNADGEAHWWLDGRKVGEYRDIQYVDATQRQWWDVVKWDPIWGGVGDTIETDMFQMIDHLYVSGGP